MPRHWLYLLASLAALGLSACTDETADVFDPDKHDHIDRDLNLSRDDYDHIAQPKLSSPEAKLELVGGAAPEMPDLADLMAVPPPPKINETQLVSIEVTEDVPVKDVLIELARLADVDIEVDSGITGGVNLTARNKPFNQVIDRLTNLAGLRYSMSNGVLRVERDEPYVKSYAIDFLNVDRTSTNQTSITTSVLSGAGGGIGGAGGGGMGGAGGGMGGAGGAAGGLSTGSSSSITSTNDGDFWRGLEAGVQQIIGYNPTSLTSAATQLDGPVPDVSIVTGAPATGVAAAAAAATGATSSQSVGAGFYTLNRQGGVLTASATDRQHEMLARFLDRLQRSATAQVLIEAKIVEITLNDRFQSGVDWSELLTSDIGIGVDFNNVDPANGVFTIDIDNEVFGGSNDLDTLIQLSQTFGTTRTLSNPRLSAINNQQAVLTFAQNLVYFELNIEQEEQELSTGLNSNQLVIDSVAHTIPIGVIMTMQPSINMDSGDVTLSVRPTLSRVVSFVEDPAVAYLAATTPGAAGIQNLVPVVEVRELDSILKLSSGEVMVIGGLMEQGSNNTDSGVPWLGEVPYVGNLFKSVDKEDSSRELVIFIRATVVGAGGFTEPADRVVYDKFTEDPRPLKF